MISFKEAKEIAFSVAGWKRLDGCSEYEKAWYFYNSAEQWDSEPGVVVMKDDGRQRTFFQFLTECSPSEEPKRLDLDGKERPDGIYVMDDGWSEEIRRALGDDKA